MTKVRTTSLCLAIGLAIFVSLVGTKQSAEAAFHLWQVREAFTNANGSVQFVEMFDSFSGEIFTNGFSLTANSDGNIKTFTFPANLPNSGSMLIATSGFGSLPGAVTPDFTFDQSSTTISGPFFDPNATNIILTFTGSGDTMTFAGASLPKDGIHSLTDAGAVGFPPGTPNINAGVNSPTNLLGNSGSVNLSNPSPTGDYNGNHVVDAGDYVVWRKTLNGSASPQGSGADGNSSGTIDAEDYTYWRARFGNAAPGSGASVGGAVPEPAAMLLLMIAAASWCLRRDRAA